MPSLENFQIPNANNKPDLNISRWRRAHLPSLQTFCNIYVCLNDENKYLVPTKHFTPTFRHPMVPFSRFLVNLTFNQVSSLNPNCENSCMQIQNSKLHLPGTLNHIAQNNKITNITFKGHFSDFFRIRPFVIQYRGPTRSFSIS